MKHQVQRILLIKRGAIGDLLMATPLIRQLVTQSQVQCDLLVGSNAAIAVKDNPYLNQLIQLPDAYFAISGVFKLISCLIAMRGSYDYVFILDKHWYFNLVARLFLKAKIIGYYRSPWQKTIPQHAVLYNDVTRYHAFYYLDLLQVSNLVTPDYTDIGLDLMISDLDKRVVDTALTLNAIHDFVVVVNSGGNNAYEQTGLRMLPLNKAIELLQGLLDKGLTIILLGGAMDYANYANYSQAVSSKDGAVYNWAGKFSLAQSAYLIAKATKFYTTDCGAMHLGVVMQVPMWAFFGPTNPRHILPPSYIEQKAAIWRDEAGFEPDYQLTGKLPAYRAFFQRLNMHEFI